MINKKAAPQKEAASFFTTVTTRNLFNGIWYCLYNQ